MVYSEKAKNFCEISTVDMTVTTYDKSTVEISQNFVASSEYMNFMYTFIAWIEIVAMNLRRDFDILSKSPMYI